MMKSWLYHVRLINTNKNLPTVVETFRRNVFTIVSNKPVMILLVVPSFSPLLHLVNFRILGSDNIFG
jgi:hypothetical protein